MSDSDDGDAGVVVGEIPPTMVRKHIKKRALRNKSLSVSFDEKNLKDFVTGFHKRKKKRRKEAQRQLQEKVRLKRIEARKQRKLEREMGLHDGNINEDPEPNDVGGDGVEEGADITASVFETKTYETGDTTIRVTTSELPRDDDDFGLVSQIPKLSSNIQMKPVPVKKKQLKRTSGRQPHKAGKVVFRKKDKRKSKVK
ncbi:ribosomal RNA-processing protein 17 [Dioscorea cayenensis subsp. rotundata]|uniref:Ribosomal RNA-processing protein 17 n=1 Tax=Dioscorea cayennensis subsp. rotundata TaxID=55577 RepID=A0AB40CBJ7_DIOCR|nr:ribosomal RNA-processing protein 17 [Dioscorea cayenensis subsp. rotundata]